MKRVWYYCPSCKDCIAREVVRATAKRKSYCNTAGKTVTMRKLKRKAA